MPNYTPYSPLKPRMPLGYGPSGANQAGFNRSLNELRAQNESAPSILADARSRRQAQMDQANAAMRAKYEGMAPQRFVGSEVPNLRYQAPMEGPAGMGVAPSALSPSGQRYDMGLIRQQAAPIQDPRASLNHLTGTLQDPSMYGSTFGKYAPAEGMGQPFSSQERSQLQSNMQRGTTGYQDMSKTRMQNLQAGYIPEGRDVPGMNGVQVKGINEAGAPILSGQNYYAQKFGGPPGSPQYEAGMKSYADAAMDRRAAVAAWREERKNKSASFRNTGYTYPGAPKAKPGILDGVAPPAPAVGGSAEQRATYAAQAMEELKHPSFAAIGIKPDRGPKLTGAEAGMAIINNFDDLTDADLAQISSGLGKVRAAKKSGEWTGNEGDWFGPQAKGLPIDVVNALLDGKGGTPKSRLAPFIEKWKAAQAESRDFGSGFRQPGYYPPSI